MNPKPEFQKPVCQGKICACQSCTKLRAYRKEYGRLRYQRRKANKICTVCNKPHTAKTVRCNDCNNAMKKPQTP
jgi:hypothetical protein